MGQYLTLIVTSKIDCESLKKSKSATETERLHLTSDDDLFRKFDSSGLYMPLFWDESIEDEDEEEEVEHIVSGYELPKGFRLYLTKGCEDEQKSISGSKLLYTSADDIKEMEEPEKMVNNWKEFRAFIEKLSDDCPVILWWT